MSSCSTAITYRNSVIIDINWGAQKQEMSSHCQCLNSRITSAQSAVPDMTTSLSINVSSWSSERCGVQHVIVVHLVPGIYETCWSWPFDLKCITSCTCYAPWSCNHTVHETFTNLNFLRHFVLQLGL